MLNLHPKDRAALERCLDELRQLHGGALRAVALHGEAASAGYRPRKSPLRIAVVVDEVSAEVLRRTREYARRWRRRRIPTPMFMDPPYIESSRDVFPLEFLELADHHQLLHGESDPFAECSIDLAHLRLEVEEQLRGKMLHLWAAYLDAGRSRRALRRLLMETPPGFTMILRGMLRLRQPADAGPGSRPDAVPELLRAVEEAFSLPLPLFHRLEDHRIGGGLRSGDPEALFRSYLAEVRALVRAIDSL